MGWIDGVLVHDYTHGYSKYVIIAKRYEILPGQEYSLLSCLDHRCCSEHGSFGSTR